MINIKYSKTIKTNEISSELTDYFYNFFLLKIKEKIKNDFKINNFRFIKQKNMKKLEKSEDGRFCIQSIEFIIICDKKPKNLENFLKKYNIEEKNLDRFMKKFIENFIDKQEKLIFFIKLICYSGIELFINYLFSNDFLPIIRKFLQSKQEESIEDRIIDLFYILNKSKKIIANEFILKLHINDVPFSHWLSTKITFKEIAKKNIYLLMIILDAFL